MVRGRRYLNAQFLGFQSNLCHPPIQSKQKNCLRLGNYSGPGIVYANDRIASSMTEMSDLGKSRLRFGSFEVDLSARELRKAGTRVKLSGQPFEILAALLERPGQLVTRDELRKRVWSDDTYVDFSHGLNAAVNKLREALCDSADDPRYIETLPRRGYRFIAELEAVNSVPDTAVDSPPKGSDKELASVPSVPNETPARLVQQWAVTSNQDSGESTAVAPSSSSQSPQPVWKASLSDDWESTIPVKRGTLVQLLSMVAGIVLLTLGTTIFWWHWSQQPSPSDFGVAPQTVRT